VTTAVQYPMWTLPVPPDAPVFWGGSEEPPPPLPVGPQLAQSAAPVAGGSCTFTANTDVPANAVLDYGPTNAYGTTVSTGFTGQGTTTQSVTVTGFTGGTTYHYRLRVTGTTPPNDLETVGADATFVGVA